MGGWPCNKPGAFHPGEFIAFRKDVFAHNKEESSALKSKPCKVQKQACQLNEIQKENH